ncbi:MAG: Restriction endonuclease subunit [Actinomycetota bacterium]|nr:Restriction endonuclease subunit [Actinomycetota bacterium]
MIWRSATLGELEVESNGVIQTGPFGSQLHSSDYSVVGTPVVMPTNIRDLQISTVGIARVADEHVERLSRHKLRAGDIVYSRRGDVEKCALVAPEEESWLCGTGCLLVRVAGPHVDARYLAYALSLPKTRDWITSHAVGATMPNLNTEVLREVPLPLPPIEAQRAIAANLGALDDKIESNRRAVTLIPQLIRARVQASLIEGSEHVSVSSLATFVNGGAFTKDASGTGRMVIRIAELNGGPGGTTIYNDISVPDDKTARAGDILMSWSGSLGLYRWARDEAIINQHIFKVIPGDLPAWLVFDRLESAIGTFRAIARDKATTMGHIQRKHLDSTLAQVPSTHAVKALDRDLSGLWKRLLVAERECLTLAELRDALLPELLAGSIRAPSETANAAETFHVQAKA